MPRRSWALAIVLASSGTAAAHPHSEVDQQVLLALEPGAVHVTIRIVPSFVLGASIFARIDTDGDGAVSEREATELGSRVLAATRVEVDGQPVLLHHATTTVPALGRVSAGLGLIEVTAAASFALASTPDHRVAFEIAYDELSHDWQVQPFFSAAFVEATSARAVERGDDAHRVDVVFSGRGSSDRRPFWH